jgi:hypothetical protein
MDKPTKLLFVGAALALLILLGGYLASAHNNSQTASLVEKCKAETAIAPTWAKLVCDPNVISKLGLDDLGGIQKQIMESITSSERTFNNAIIFAISVFLLFGAPFAWYFLLRRIRELREAIAGK